MTETLSERSKNILNAVINEYMLTGEAVGSRTISKKYSVGLSPASVRNVMADLEESGFLSQPHTSAGRIPTDKGLRYYVDCILQVRLLTKQEKASIESRYRPSNLEIIDVMKETSKLLSKFSRYTGVVLAPKFETVVFKHIEFIKVTKNQVLAVFVSKAGTIQNKVIEIEDDLSQDDLYKSSKYLNDILTDLTLREVRNKIVDEMKQQKNMADWFLSMALQLSQKAFTADVKDDVYIEGKLNIFECREFCSVEKIKTLFHAFEEKSILIKLLDKAMNYDGIQILIGTENEFHEIQECSIVASPYTWRESAMGTLGVIGPTRMDYCYIVPIVDYTAKTVSRIIDKRY